MDKLIKKALRVMEEAFTEGTEKFSQSGYVKDYCRLKIGQEKDEVFCVIFLDNHLRLLEFKEFFRGTVNQSSVFLRPIVRRALELNASKIILTHNHPSGIVTASKADIEITKRFNNILTELDCEIVDHIIVSPTNSLSMVETGISID